MYVFTAEIAENAELQSNSFELSASSAHSAVNQKATLANETIPPIGS
jgi:hypothetical protein